MAELNLFIGNKGGGKTTLACYLAQYAHQTCPNVPIVTNTPIFFANIPEGRKRKLSEDLEEGKEIISPDFKQQSASVQDETAVISKIKEMLENYVKPAVEMDGGAIQFRSYEEGKVNLMLQGSCSGCPSSMITLKAGIEGMMKRMIPEVKEVVAEAE